MNSFSYHSVSDFQSPLRVAFASVLESRFKLRDRLTRLGAKFSRFNIEHQRLVNEKRRLESELKQSRAELAELKRERSGKQAHSVQLPEDLPLANHQFGAGMISFCCQLCNVIGFRSTHRVLPLIQQWLGISFDIPSRWTMRLWNSRNGVAILKESATVADDWIWMIDHSVQLGKMCVLVVLGIRQSQLPQGRALVRQDMKPLALLPTDSRSKEEVGDALVELAAKIGTPIGVVADGAAELHQGVKSLEKSGAEVVMLDDIKHKAANVLKATIGKDERFTKFVAHAGRTKANIQQTELEHFLPPKKRTKCRFMNFGKLIDWADLVLAHLKQPEATGNRNISKVRLHEKLGWLAEFENDLKQWRECREVVSTTLQFTNTRGVESGATEELKTRLTTLDLQSSIADKISRRLVQCYAENEEKLSRSKHAALRMPVSTEVLESSLGSFKAIQRHHNRGTFTTLLAIFPTLFQITTPEKIRRRLASVSTKNLRKWLAEKGLNNSTQAKKTAAYKYAKRLARQKNNYT